MMPTVSLLIAFVAAYWVYNDAKNRGHESSTAILWALGTFAMLIVFLPLYLIFGRKTPIKKAPRDENIIDVEATVVEDSINCPMCGSKVKEDFKICPYCGYTLNPKCENCGQELKRDWKVCPNCQTPAVKK